MPRTLAITLAAFLLLASTLTPDALAHPQDGPHADIRARIDEDAVRLNVVMNLVFLDGIADTMRESLADLHPAEEPGVRAALEHYFKEENRLEIDGVVVTPLLSDFEVLRPGPELLPLFPITGMRGLMRVRFVATYSAKALPDSVTMVWATFPNDLLAQRIAEEVGQTLDEPPPLTIEAQLEAEGMLEIIRFTRDEPGYTWHASGLTSEDRFRPVPKPAPRERVIPLPLISIALVCALFAMLATTAFAKRGTRALLLASPVLLIGAALTMNVARVELRLPGSRPLPDQQESLAIFQPLHANIYRAFDYADEGDIYDALARSVDGPLLDALYNQIFRSLIMHEEGGAVSRVQQVRPVDAAVLTIGELGDDQAGFRVRARWQVDGVVYHWGHSHTRTNEYHAEYDVVERAEGWRIASSTILEQFRVDAAPLPPPDEEI